MPSSVVARIKYMPSSKILRVTFVSGDIYEYMDVPAEAYEEMKTAESKGKYLNESIKGHYAFKKIDV